MFSKIVGVIKLSFFTYFIIIGGVALGLALVNLCKRLQVRNAKTSNNLVSTPDNGRAEQLTVFVPSWRLAEALT